MNLTPTPDGSHITAARDRLEKAVLELILANQHGDLNDPHCFAVAEHADERVALAARDLVRAIDTLPAGEQPVGWREGPTPKTEEAN